MENQQLTGIMITLDLYYSDGDTLCLCSILCWSSAQQKGWRHHLVVILSFST